MVNNCPTATYDDGTLDGVFRALADPTRRRIVAELAHVAGERTVGELAAPLEMSLPAVSKHLGILERAGLLQRRRDGRTHHLKLEPNALKPAVDWIEQQRRFWEGSFDQLANFLESSLPDEDEGDADPGTLTKQSITN